MKKQFTLLLVTLLGMLGFAANAQISVTFDVSGEGSVSVCSLGTTTELAKVSQGKTTVTLPGYSNSSFTLVPDANTEIENAVNLDYNDYGTKNSNGTWTINRVYGGDTWTITVKAKSGGDPTPTVKTTILNLLSDANVDVYCSNPWGKTQSLKKGENVVEIPNRSYYIAALGVTNQSNLIVKADGEGNPLYVYGAADFGGQMSVSAMFNSATAADSYTIEVVGGTVVPETYTFDVTLTGKAAVKYQNGSPTWEVVNLSAGTNKVSIPKAVSAFYFVPTDDYTLESCVDSKGNALSTFNSFSLGTTYKIETASLADGYTLVTKAPAPAVKTIVLDVLTADADIVVWCKNPWTKEKTLVAGENIVEIPAAAYYIVANGVSNPAELIVKDPDGNELWVKNETSFGSGVKGVNVEFNSDSAPAKYTIEVKEAAEPETFNFNVNVTGKAILKYQNGSPEFIELALNEGANPVEIPRSVTTFYFVAAEGYTLESCVNQTNTPLSIYNSFSLGDTYRVFTESLSGSYTLVTKENAPAVKTTVLDVLTADADIVLFNRTDWKKAQNLVAGENTVEIPAVEYAIVANGVTNVDDLIVKDPEGNSLWVTASQKFEDGLNGVSVVIKSATAADKYTIEVKEPEAPKTLDFVVNLTGKATLKYLDGSWTDIVLQEGDNEVKVPATANNILIVATDDYVLESCVNKEGESIAVTTSYALPGFPKVFKLPYDNLSESYTVVTVDPNAPTVTTFTLNIDNVANVVVWDQNSKSIPNLVNGENLLDPETYTKVDIRLNGMAAKPIYSCTLDGEPIQEVNAAYTVNPTKAGQVIDVVTVWPDVKYTVEFAYTDAQGVWTQYSVGDPFDSTLEKLDIVDNKIEVEAGANVNLYSDDINKYTFNEKDEYGMSPGITGLNGEKLTVSTYSGRPNVMFNVTKSGTVTTDATKKIEIPVTINIDGNPADVQVKYGSSTTPPYQYQLIPDLKKGANTFTVTSGDIISVTALNEATVTMTYKVAGDAEVKSPAAPDYYGAVYTDAFTGLGAEVNITITGGTGPVYDKEFAVNIDGFGGKLMYRPLTGGVELFRSLEPGLNNVGLTKEDQSLIGGQLYIVPADGWDFTECTDAEGNPITILSSNDFPSYVDVYTYQPRSEYNFKGVSTDQDATLTLEGPADFWTKILVNKNEVTPEDGKLNIRYNDMVELYNQDIAAWKVNSIIDPATGKQVYISGYTEYPLLAFNIKGDWTLTVDARRLTKYNVTVNVTTANLVRLRKGTTNVTLRNGENTIEVSELDTDPFYVSLRDADKGYIVAVQSQANADAELVPAEFEAGVYTIARFDGEGGLLNIDVQAEAEALVYTDKATNLIDCKENAIALTEGYNHVALHYADAPFAFEGEPAVYVNYEALEGGLTLRADDVCKAFYEAAQPLTVTFTVAPAEEGQAEADAAFGNVTRDYVTPVADVTAPFTVMPGTFLSFMTVTAEGLEYEVTINGEKVEGVENVYTTTITADTEIKLVYNNPGNGIVTIGRDQLDLNAVYFDLAGRRIDARNIAAGIYIRVAGNTATKIAVK